MKSIVYTKPDDGIGSLMVTPRAPIHNYEADELGIVCGNGLKKASVVPWNTVAFFLPAALAVSPKLRADIRTMIDAADNAAKVSS